MKRQLLAIGGNSVQNQLSDTDGMTAAQGGNHRSRGHTVHYPNHGAPHAVGIAPATYESAASAVRGIEPVVPIVGMRPHAAARAAEWFLENFPGDVAYAYKANDAPLIIGALYAQGIRHFDVASLSEVERASVMKDAKLHFMHPIKSREAIRIAYSKFGVRTFAIDCEDELHKIEAETDRAPDLLLVVRMAVPNLDSAIPLDRKFGVEPRGAIGLLKSARRIAAQVGVSFHVGSQMLRPENYTLAIAASSEVASAAGVKLDVLDVGGGFPAYHPNSKPESLSLYIEAIKSARLKYGLQNSRLMSEPGRALVAEAESVIVKMLGRKGHNLYINDGTYGSFFEGAKIYGGLSYPVRMIRGGQFYHGALEEFVMWGPSCDSIDHMPGPFFLPSDVKEGDYIEVGHLGAYGRVSRSNFNGCGQYGEIVLEDEPIRSMYDGVVKHKSATAAG